MDDAKPANNTSTKLGRERTRQAADRTLMAWVRTSLSLIGFGFGIAKYRDILMKTGVIQRPSEEFNPTLIFGLSFISLGVFGLLAAVIQHWRILQAIKHDPLAFPVFKPLTMFMAIILLLIGAFAFAGPRAFQRGPSRYAG